MKSWINNIIFVLIFAMIIGLLPYEHCGNASFAAFNFQENYKAARRGDPNAISILRTLAEQGNDEAQFKLGYMYYVGQGVKENLNEATKWIHRSAIQGNPEAQWQLGVINRGDAKESLYWYVQAAKQGYINAVNSICDIIMLSRNYSKALSALRDIGEKGNPEAQFQLGRLYEKGNDIKQDKKEAAKWYKKVLDAAEHGNSQAQTLSGVMYKNGNGVGQDYQKTMEYFLRAIEQRDSTAQYYLASMYENGEGVQQDYQEALRLYHLAAEQGNIKALISLGDMYYNGKGVNQDYKESAKWYCKAEELEEGATHINVGSFQYRLEKGDNGALSLLRELALQGDDYAQYWIGRMIEAHKIDSQNDETAIMWYCKSAENGNDSAVKEVCLFADRDVPEAISTLCTLAKNGHERAVESIPKLAARGIPEALEIVRGFAEKGDVEAQFALGVAYLNGTGLKKDYLEAIKWFSRASEQDDDRAKALLGLMYYNGDGVKQNYFEAAKLFKRSSLVVGSSKMLKDANIQFALGVMSRDGIDEKQDLEKAVGYFSQAASQGHGEALSAIHELAEQNIAEAQHIWGYYTYMGELVDKNKSEGIEWLVKAIKHGNGGAYQHLKEFAQNGDSNALSIISDLAWNSNNKVSYDIRNNARWTVQGFAEKGNTKAFEIIRKLAEKGNDDAQYRLGGMYAQGKGVQHDEQEARNWWRKASAQGNRDAKSILAYHIYHNIGNDDIKAKSFKTNGSIAGDNVNVRKSPNKSSKVVKQLNTGHPVNVGQKKGDWFFIQTASGTKGWVFWKYVKFK